MIGHACIKFYSIGFRDAFPAARGFRPRSRKIIPSGRVHPVVERTAKAKGAESGIAPSMNDHGERPVVSPRRSRTEELAFPVATLMGTLFGLAVPVWGEWTRSWVVYLLVPLMVFSLVKIRSEEMRDGLRRLDLLLIGLIFIYAVVPLAVWGLGLAAGLAPELLFGVTLAALSPTIVLAPFFTDMIGGNRVLAVLISVVSTFLSPILIPALLLPLVGQKVDVPVWTITINAGILVGLPVLIAYLARKARPRLKEGPVPLERYITSFIFFWFIAGVIASSLGGRNLLSAGMGLLLVIALVQEWVFFFALRYILGKLAERKILSLGNAKALSLCIGVKNGALTAGIALTFSCTVAISSGLITLVSAPLFILYGIFREKM